MYHFTFYNMLSSHLVSSIILKALSESLLHIYQPPQRIAQLRRPSDDKGPLRRPSEDQGPLRRPFEDPGQLRRLYGGGLPPHYRETALRFQQVILNFRI